MKLTPQQKLEALSHKYYGRAEWSPAAGDLYTTCRADLEVYEVVEVAGGTVQTRYTEGSDSIAEWPESEFTTGGFGPMRVWIPPWVLANPDHEP